MKCDSFAPMAQPLTKINELRSETKMSKSLAILSSYDVSCGNATFTKVIVDSVNNNSDGWKATPIELNLTLNQHFGRKEAKAANADFKEIAARLKHFDALNIQFEAGLYGVMPSQIKRRLKRIIKSSQNVSITMHSPKALTNYHPRKDAVRFLMRGRLLRAIKAELEFHRINWDVLMNRQILNYLKRKSVPVIVHTLRSQEVLQKVLGLSRVYCHPIMLTENSSKGSLEDASIRQELGLEKDLKYVGLFGFITKYKGHSEALDALRLLPKDYKFVIAGRIHPQSLSNLDATSYVTELVKKINKDKKLRNRVNFVGELNEKDFERLISNVDCCLLAYHEVGQDASGIASLCFELGKTVVASHSKAFDELIKLLPMHATFRFDIENSIEMAEQIQRAISAPKTSKLSSQYNLESQKNLYLEVFSLPN